MSTPEGLVLLRNFLYLCVLRGIDFLVPLIVVPYLVVTVGLENYGILALSMTLSIYVGTFVQYGFSVTAVRDISRVRDDREGLAVLYSVTLAAACLLAFVAAIVFFILVITIPLLRENWIVYSYALFYVVIQSVFPIWLFQGVEKMQYIAIASLFSKIAYVIAIFLFIKGPEDYELVNLLNGCSAGVSLLVGLYIIDKVIGVKFRRLPLSSVVATLKKGFNVFLNQLAPNLYNNTTVLLLGIFSGSYVLGAYSASATLVEAVVSLGRVVSSAFFPLLSRSMKLFKAFQFGMIVAGLALSAIATVFSKELALILFKDNSEMISNFVFWLSIGILPAFGYIVYNTIYLMLVGQGRLASKISIVSSLFFFIVSLLIVPNGGVYYAIAIIVCARVTMAAWSYFIYRSCEL